MTSHSEAIHLDQKRAIRRSDPTWRPIRAATRESSRIVARLDRKRLGQDTFTTKRNSIRGVFDKQTRRKPLAFAADAVRYGV